MAQTVIGIFDSTSEAQNAVQQLINTGFTRSNIDISSQSGTDYSTNYADRDRSATSANRDNDDSFGDSVGDFFKNLFGGDDRDEVSRYSDVARRGSVVTVHAQSSDEAERAADILDEYGAVDVNERYTQYSSNAGASTGTFAATDSVDDNYNTTRADLTDITDNIRTDVTDSTESLPIIEEELHVSKRIVQTGGVRLRSRIVERPVEETLRLREEHVRVERNAVNRPATEADLNNFREGTIELTEQTEVPVVSKDARVVEEVSLSKDVEEREEIIRDTVRRTEVDVDNLDKGEQYRDRDIDLDRDRDIDSDGTYRRQLDND